MDSDLDTLISQAIQNSLLTNLLFINESGQRYYNNPPIGGYILNEENDYIIRGIQDRDDLSSIIFLDVATRFGSPGSESSNALSNNYKKYRRTKIKNLGTYKKIKESDPILLLLKQCPICIDDFCCGEYQRTLDCGHCFHKKCIDRWFKKDKNDCPMCRAKIIISE